MSTEQRLLLVIGLVLISGCAGNQALIWRQTAAPQEPCEIPVCEKVNPRDKECWRNRCMTQRELEEMTRMPPVQVPQ